MGCENSKSVRVQPGGPISDSTSVLGKEEGTQTPVTKHKQHKDGTNQDNAEYQLDEHGNKVKSRRRKAGNKEREAQKIGNSAGDSKDQAQDRNERVQESQIMQRLQDEGLISRPQIEASGGMRFESLPPWLLGEGRREEERLAKLRERERTDAVAALEDFVQ
ncbi:hypothetical protein ACOMHN_037270 [Nucella lapillus]